MFLHKYNSTSRTASPRQQYILASVFWSAMILVFYSFIGIVVIRNCFDCRNCYNIIMKWECCMMLISDWMKFRCCSCCRCSCGCRRGSSSGRSSRSFFATFNSSITHQLWSTGFFQFRCSTATVVIIPWKVFRNRCLYRQYDTNIWPYLNLNSTQEILNPCYSTLDTPK